MSKVLPNESAGTAAFKIDFIGVGAPKCGTTWLASCLSEHPELCMADPTALNYFCDETIWPEFRAPSGLGLDWVAERFAHCKAGKRLVEISPNYLYDRNSPRRILEHNQACRLIFTFRHPVEVVTSYYYQIAKESLVPATVEGFLQKYPEVRRIGLYHRHLAAFLEVFPREQCLFLLFDDVQSDPAAVVQRSYSFLGVASDFVPPSLNRRINERKIPRSRAMMAAMNRTRRFLQEHTSGRAWRALVWKLRLYRLHDWVLQRNLKPFAPIPLPNATRRQLLDFYREDTRALARFLERDLGSWEH
jgi:Sulfotransferase domain